MGKLLEEQPLVSQDQVVKSVEKERKAFKRRN